MDQDSRLSLLLSLEARQDELLVQLDELDRRVQQVLSEYQTPATTEKGFVAMPADIASLTAVSTP
jgi:hypothetical protein